MLIERILVEKMLIEQVGLARAVGSKMRGSKA
jgi:hypothetical protein